MADRALDACLRRLAGQLAAVRQPERRRILKGVRGHLEREAQRLGSIDRALEDFGDPAQLRLTLGPGAAIVRRGSGEVVLAVDDAVLGADRHALRSVTRWTLACLGGLVLVALALAAVLALVGYDLPGLFRREVVEGVPRPLYAYESSWSQVSPSTNVVEQGFTVPGNARGFDIRFITAPELGCVAIQLVGPTGQTTSVNGNGCAAYNEETAFAQAGDWRVRYTYAAFAGSVRAQAVWYESAEDAPLRPTASP